VFTCRSNDKLQQTVEYLEKIKKPGTVLVPMQLDLASLSSTKQFIQDFKNKRLELNVLIANAGIMRPGFHLTEDGLESQWQVNHLSHHLLIRELLPNMKGVASKETPGRVVIVSSGSHQRAPDPLPMTVEDLNNASSYDDGIWYGNSKMANILESNHLSTVVGEDIYVNSVHPGLVGTNIARHWIKEENGGALHMISSWIKRLMWDPETAALTVLAPAVGNVVISNQYRGRYWIPIGRVVPFAQVDRSLDLDLSRRYYEFSERVLKEKGY